MCVIVAKGVAQARSRTKEAHSTGLVSLFLATKGTKSSKNQKNLFALFVLLCGIKFLKQSCAPPGRYLQGYRLAGGGGGSEKFPSFTLPLVSSCRLSIALTTK